MRENNLISNHTHAIVVNTVTLSYNFAQLIFHFRFGSGPHKRFYKEALGVFNTGNIPTGTNFSLISLVEFTSILLRTCYFLNECQEYVIKTSFTFYRSLRSKHTVLTEKH